jgi:hypothetical protein
LVATQVAVHVPTRGGGGINQLLTIQDRQHDQLFLADELCRQELVIIEQQLLPDKQEEAIVNKKNILVATKPPPRSLFVPWDTV